VAIATILRKKAAPLDAATGKFRRAFRPAPPAAPKSKIKKDIFLLDK